LELEGQNNFNETTDDKKGVHQHWFGQAITMWHIDSIARLIAWLYSHPYRRYKQLTKAAKH